MHYQNRTQPTQAELTQWVIDAMNDMVVETTAANRYSTDPTTGLSQMDVMLMIVEELRGIKQELRELK